MANVKSKHGTVDADFIDARKAIRCNEDQDAQSGVSKTQSERAAEETESNAFQEKFAGDAVRAGAESGANGEFLAAAFDADEEKVGDVRASDEQDEADGAHEHPERAANVADDVRFQRAEIRADAGVVKNLGAESRGSGKGARDDRQHASDVGAGLFHGDAGLEASDTFEAEIAEKGFVAVPFEGKDDGGIVPNRESESAVEERQ